MLRQERKPGGLGGWTVDSDTDYSVTYCRDVSYSSDDSCNSDSDDSNSGDNDSHDNDSHDNDIDSNDSEAPEAAPYQRACPCPPGACPRH